MRYGFIVEDITENLSKFGDHVIYLIYYYLFII